MNPHPPLAVAMTALVTAGLVSGCTAAPSGRLDTAQNGATVSEQPPAPAPVSALPTFDPSSTVGGYATGFPSTLVAVPPGATIIASSAQPVDGGLTQISLNLSSPASTNEVLAQLAAPLVAAGFAQTTPQALSGLTAQTAWTRRSERPQGPLIETLLVGVLDDGERRLVSISGTVQAPAS